jgi:hypothetical protein
MEQEASSTRLLVARFWEWYEVAPRNERQAFGWTPDFGRSQHVDATAWTVLPPEASMQDTRWRAYPSGLAEPPKQGRILTAESKEHLYTQMADFQSEAYAWAKTQRDGTGVETA